jgi:Sigma-70, region 4
LLKHRRAEARRLRASARIAAVEATDRRASAAALDARLRFPRVADAIEALPGDEREVLLLFAWEDLPYQSMAEALELPIGTVRSRLIMIGDEVSVGGPGTCAFFPRNVPHAWKSTGTETGRVLFLYTPAAAGGYVEELLNRPRPMNADESKQLRERYRWEVVGPNPL